MRQRLHAEFVLLADPNDAEIRGLASHAHIQDFACPHAAAYALNHHPAATHVGDLCGFHERLATGVETPDFYGQLNRNPRAAAAIHGLDCEVSGEL